MSCTTNQASATTNFNSASYAGSAALIQLEEETTSAEVCTLYGARGKIQLDLTAYPRGTATVYFKVGTQTNGVGTANTPPVTADSLYHSALSATMGIVNTSAYYANVTPTFSAANNCVAADKKLGWILNDQVAAVAPTFTYFV